MLGFRGRFVACPETRNLILSPLLRGKALSEHESVLIAGVSVRSSFCQTVQRIQHERQTLKSDIDPRDSCFGSFLVNRGQGQNRLTDQGRFVGQYFQTCALRLPVGIHIVGRQNAEHAVHCQRLGSVDIEHPGVWNRTGEQSGVNHALTGIVLCVFNAASNLARYIRRHEVFTNMHIGHDDYPSCTARMTPSR